MIVKLLTEHHLEFLSLKGGCRGSSESTHVKMPNCLKSHALAQIYYFVISSLSDLPVLHLISTPFPKVWHKMADNEKALNYDVIDNFLRIFRVFVSNYLDLPERPCGKK